MGIIYVDERSTIDLKHAAGHPITTGPVSSLGLAALPSAYDEHLVPGSSDHEQVRALDKRATPQLATTSYFILEER